MVPNSPQGALEFWQWPPIPGSIAPGTDTPTVSRATLPPRKPNTNPPVSGGLRPPHLHPRRRHGAVPADALRA